MKLKEIFGFDVQRAWEYENGYYITSHPTRLAKAIAHYELYKSVVDLPGHIVECGVYKGSSLLRFATYREILESPYSRKIIGFDAFGKFPQYPNQASDDSKFIQQFESAGGDGISVVEMEEVLQHKGITNVELIEGDILRSLPEYINAHLELKIALLHIDVDVFVPTMTALKLLFPRVVRGGIVVFDDYGTVAGETEAVDDFISEMGYTVNKLPLSHVPAYIRK